MSDPNKFDRQWYLRRYRDVAESGLDPLEHYQKIGRYEGRRTQPEPLAKAFRVYLRMLPTALQLKGSWSSVAKASTNVYSSEGNSGLRDRFYRLYEMASAKLAAEESYQTWYNRFDPIQFEISEKIIADLLQSGNCPLISVLLPTYNTKLHWLEETVQSVLDQSYPHWELCICDDASTDLKVIEYLTEIEAQHSNIRVLFRDKNGHISAASNSALGIVQGEWVALLDHDDLLTKDALVWVADTIAKNPSVNLIYSDEDKIDENGRRYDPHHKSEWNRDLIYSVNFFSHLGVYRKSLLDKTGGFRVGTEGAQDHDLVLRCLEQIEESTILHIPHILYHWRSHSESTADNIGAKPYAKRAGVDGISRHLKVRGMDAKVASSDSGYRVQYALPSKKPKVTLIVPTRNGGRLLKQCIDSILQKTIYDKYEILIIDNGSDETETVSHLDRLKKNEPRVKVLRDERPFNYSALNNAAVAKIRTRFIGLINDDIEVVKPEWLTEMISHACRPEVGAVGAKLLYPDGRLQHGGVITGVGGIAGHANKMLAEGMPGYFSRANQIQQLSAVTAACLIVERKKYLKVGGLNETDLTVAFNDVDFCLKLDAVGYRNIWTPYALLYHHESASRGSENDPKKIARFAKEMGYMKSKWQDRLLNDPAYNPNLTLDREDFSLAWPPRTSPFSHDNR